MKTLSIVILSLLIFACSSEKYDLALNLKEGKTYTQTSTTSMSITMDIQGQKSEQKIDIIGKLSYKVLKDHGKYYEMEVTYKKLIWKVIAGSSVSIISSENYIPNDPVSSMFRSVIDSPFKIKLTKKGKITSVEGLDLLRENMISSITNLPEENKELMREELQKVISEETLKGSFEQVSAIFPEKSVSKRERWKSVVDLNTNNIPMTLKTEYKLTSISDKEFTLSGTSEIEFPIKRYQNIQGLEVKYDLTGSMTSTIKVDRQTGWLINAEANQIFSGKAHIRSNQYFPKGTLLPIKMKQVVITTGN